MTNGHALDCPCGDCCIRREERRGRRNPVMERVRQQSRDKRIEKPERRCPAPGCTNNIITHGAKTCSRDCYWKIRRAKRDGEADTSR